MTNALATLTDATRMLAEVRSVDDARKIISLAEAARVYAKQADLGLVAQNHAAEIKLRAQRRAGEILAQMDKNEGGRPSENRLQAATGLQPTLQELGIEKTSAFRWQAIAAIPEIEFEEHINRALDEGQELTTAGMVRAAKEAGGVPANFQSTSNEWYTPAEYIEAARVVMGGIDLDPASNAQANEVVQAATYFTQHDDGLTRPWPGRVWLNPPYGIEDGGSSAGLWASRLIEQYRAGITTEAILLVNAVTERRWFQPLWDFPICFTDHRIRFYTSEGTPQQPVSGNAFVYLGENIYTFAFVFLGFGPVVTRIPGGPLNA